MLKQLIILLLFTVYMPQLVAQKKGMLKLSVEPGILLFSASDNLGLLLNVEPKFKFSEKSFIGLRVGMVLNSQKFFNQDSDQFYIGEQFDHGVISFMPTFDYYFNENKYKPYLGAGFGVYIMSDIDVAQININPPEGIVQVGVVNQLGFLCRGGFESKNLRIGLEYNFVRKADIKLRNGQLVGTVDNSYFGISMGYVFGERDHSKPF